MAHLTLGADTRMGAMDPMSAQDRFLSFSFLCQCLMAIMAVTRSGLNLAVSLVFPTDACSPLSVSQQQ